MLRAVSIGVVFNRLSGQVVRVINPDYEWQLDLVERDLASSEYFWRVPKEAFGVSKKKNAMTLSQVDRVCKALGPRS